MQETNRTGSRERDQRIKGNYRAQRKPKTPMRIEGAFLLRVAPRTLPGLLPYQLPPRLTRPSLARFLL